MTKRVIFVINRINHKINIFIDEYIYCIPYIEFISYKSNEALDKIRQAHNLDYKSFFDYVNDFRIKCI